MGTIVEVDEQLLAQAMAATGLRTKRATVEEGLWALMRLHGQSRGLAELKRLGWDGDLDRMRRGWPVRRP